MVYFYDENFVLPLSHDEVVHGKSPMIYKMPGDEWQRFANLRVLYTYMFTHPGGKLLFMGNEFGQTSEWNFEKELDWKLLQYEPHAKLKDLVKALNHLYTSEPALFEYQFDKNGFEWVDLSNRDECVIVYRRMGKRKKDDLLIIFNMTPVERPNWNIQAKGKKNWNMIFCSDDDQYWGSGRYPNKEIEIIPVDKKEKLYEIKLDLPALSAIVLK